MNKNIKKAKNKFEILLVFITIIQLMFVVIINAQITNILQEQNFNIEQIKMLKLVVSIVLIVIYVCVYGILYIQKIRRLKKLMYVEPNFGIIEDVVIYSWGKSDNKTEYKITPIIRNIKDNKLYMTYGNYSASFYNTLETRHGINLSYKAIFRNDGTEVKIGDNVTFYMIKTVSVDVKWHRKEDWFILNNKRMKIFCKEQKASVDILKNIVFFEGAVEVEKII